MSELTQSRLKEILSYDILTGVFVWLRSGRSSINEGRKAGCNNNGYNVIGIEGKQWRAHRLAFLYVLGYIPSEVDHIDHDRGNNKWINLRPVSHQENNKNIKLAATNTSGFTGVNWKEKDRKWYARIQVDGKLIYLGGFDGKEDAIECRKKANIKYGFHENHGKALSTYKGGE